MGVSADVTIGLVIQAAAFAVPNSLFQTVAGAGFPFLCGSIGRGTISCQSQFFEGNQVFSHRGLEEKGVENFPEPEAWSHIRRRIFFKLAE